MLVDGVTEAKIELDTGVSNIDLNDNYKRMLPCCRHSRKSKSLPPCVASVNSIKALHIWDNQDDSPNPLLRYPPSASAGLNGLCIYITLLSAFFFTEPPRLVHRILSEGLHTFTENS